MNEMEAHSRYRQASRKVTDSLMLQMQQDK